MAVITTDTFDPLKAWISVRLQQGVPIVDADWNESDDARRFELRAYLKWFVGDGVPEGNDGFHIAPPPAAASGNFLIRTHAAIPGGTSAVDGALRYAGRCLVDGLDVIIGADTQFTAQPLHPSQPNAAALAAAWSGGGNPAVTVIDTAPLTTVGVANITVYLDVWERLVTPTEAPSMILPALGIESCARRKREWVVRVASGLALPVAPAGHSYYVLGRIARPSATPVNIVAAHITDLREQRLLTPPSTIITDAFGGTVSDYRRGVGRPAGNLRDAINSLARGETPGTVEATVDTAPSPSLPLEFMSQMFVDGAGGLIALWTPNDLFTTAHAYAARLDLANPGAGFSTPPVKLNPAGTMGVFPKGVRLPNGDLLIVYGKAPTLSGGDVVYRRAATFASILAAPEQIVANSAAVEGQPLPVLAGNFVVFFFKVTSEWRYRRWNHLTSTWLDAAPVAPPNATANSLSAAADPAGNVWVALDPPAGINVFRLSPATNVIDQAFTYTAPAANDFTLPSVAIVGTEPWVFWKAPLMLQTGRFTGTWEAATTVPFTTSKDSAPNVTLDDAGRLVLAFFREMDNNLSVTYLMCGNPSTASWGQPMLLAPTSGKDGAFGGAPLLARDPGRGLWAMWNRLSATRFAALYRRVLLPL